MGFAPSFGARASALDDPYGPASVPPPSAPSSPSDAPASVRSVKKRVGDVWLETPTEAPRMELDIDLDSAPASLRDAVLGRREGASAGSPTDSDAGLEMDLPGAESPPSSRRPKPRHPAPATPAAGPASSRGRNPSAPPLGADMAGPARAPLPSSPPISRSTPAPASVRPGLVAAVNPRTTLSTSPQTASAPPRLASQAGSVAPPNAARLQPRPPGAVSASTAPAAPAPAAAPPPTLFQRIGVAVILLILAIAILVTDLILRASGPGLMFGSIRSFWFAALFFVVGAVLFFWRLLGDQGDG
jgi:hypothetical protein